MRQDGAGCGPHHSPLVWRGCRLCAALVMLAVLPVLLRCDGDSHDSPGLAIYLLEDEELTGLEAGELELEELTLAEGPVLTEHEIIAYGWDSHMIWVREGALSDWPQPLDVSVLGIPFVVVAGGQRRYLGAIWHGLSSYPFEHPVILLEWFGPVEKPDSLLKIERCFPGSCTLTDERDDPLVKQTLLEAGVLFP